MQPHHRILVPIDTPDADRAVALATQLAGHVGGVKLGKEFFTANGPDGVARVTAGGQPLFLDLKWHDIPNTVVGAVRAAAPLKPLMINVHAAGGRAMMEAAARANAEANPAGARPILLAVTVLTSLDQDDLAATGVAGSVEDQVLRLAALARDAGLDGVVCSPREIAALRAANGPDFKLVVPGIRPAWASTDDQKRVLGPAEAVALGADYLVIGRPITGADDPVAAAKRVRDELEQA
ncbi:MAG: orotidine-5'-phosphate decarboxylase [Rhodospirillaceae bacterium]